MKIRIDSGLHYVPNKTTICSDLARSNAVAPRLCNFDRLLIT